MKNISGFTIIEGLMVALVMVGIVGVGQYVISSNNDNADKASEALLLDQASNSAEPTTEETTISADWFEYESDDYYMKIPDGWRLLDVPSSGLLGFNEPSVSDTSLEYIEGVAGSVTPYDFDGDGYAVQFSSGAGVKPKSEYAHQGFGCETEKDWRVADLGDGKELTTFDCIVTDEEYYGRPIVATHSVLQGVDAYVEAYNDLTYVDESKRDERLSLTEESLKSVRFK